jgi:hypothetical protein
MCNASTDEEQESQGPCFAASDPTWVIVNEMCLTVECQAGVYITVPTQHDFGDTGNSEKIQGCSISYEI